MRTNKAEGYIYLMRLEENLSPLRCPHKIGISISPEVRASQLGIILPYPIEIVHSFWVRNMRETEIELHNALREYHLQGEWFRPKRQWVNWFRSLSQYFLDNDEYPVHEIFVHGRSTGATY